MECLICGHETNPIDSAGDYEQRACPRCGLYKITRTALTTLEHNGCRLDPDRVRQWVFRQTPTTVPLIDTQIALQLIVI